MPNGGDEPGVPRAGAELARVADGDARELSGVAGLEDGVLGERAWNERAVCEVHGSVGASGSEAKQD